MMSRQSKDRGVKVAAGFAGFVLGGALAFGQYGQYGPPPQNGYGNYYHEQPGYPHLGARQGWIAGMAQGQSDREYAHDFRPTKAAAYKHVPRSPQDYPRDEFKNEYRDAFVRGYSHGYGRE